MTKTPEPMDNDNRPENRKGDTPRGGLAMLLMLIGVMLVAALVWQQLAGSWAAERVDYSIFLEQSLASGQSMERVQTSLQHCMLSYQKMLEEIETAAPESTKPRRPKPQKE